MEKKIYSAKRSITLLTMGLMLDLLLILSFPSLVPFVIGSVWLIKELLVFCRTNLTITSEKIIGKQGVLKVTYLNLPLNEVESVETNQNFFGKIFDHGSIIIKTSSDTFVFKCIPNPNSFKYILDNEIEKSKKLNKDKV